MMFRKTLIAAALTAFAAPAAAQEAEDFTARLNRLPSQAAEPAAEPMVEPEVEPTPEPPAPPVEDITSRLNRAPGGAAPTPQPEPESEAETSSEPPILEGLSERLEQMRREPDVEPEPAPESEVSEPEPVAPEPEPAPPEPEPEPAVEAEPEAPPPEPDPVIEPEPEPEDAPEPVPEAIPQPAPPPALEILGSQAGLAFRVDVPPSFDLVERPSGPDFDVYQVSRGDTPFVGIYVGCCSPFPIYDGRQVEASGRYSILINEDGANRAVEHLFTRESDGRQIHVWLHSVTGEDRALAERIAQTVDPR
jgi:hypothetical protein